MMRRFCRKCGFKMMSRQQPKSCPYCGYVDESIKAAAAPAPGKTIITIGGRKMEIEK